MFQRFLVATVIAVGLLLVLCGLGAYRFESGRRDAERAYQEAPQFARLSPFGAVAALTILPLSESRAASPQLKTDRGLAYLVRAGAATILMDLGCNPDRVHPSPLVANARTLNVDLARIDMLFLTHLHPDHVGAAWESRPEFFRASEGPVPLPDVPACVPEPIRPSPWNPDPRVEIVAAPRVLAAGIASTGAIPQYLLLMGRTDEAALAVNLEGKGIVLLVGCTHAGIGRLAERARALFDEPLYGIVGGLHLRANSGSLFEDWVGEPGLPAPGNAERRAEETIDALRKLDLKFIAVSPHDSSDWVLGRFREAFGGRFHEVQAGLELFP